MTDSVESSQMASSPTGVNIDTSPDNVRHSNYYFEPVIFCVEGVLFKVPRNGFMIPGTFLHDLFSLPVAPGTVAQGSTDSDPIDLPVGISETEFFGFLLVVYPYFGRDHGEMTYEEWVGALKLATMWEFHQIRQKVIHSLSPRMRSRNVVENILLAKEYRVKQWLRDGYLKLVANENLTIQDLRSPLQLDWETIAGVFATQSFACKKGEADKHYVGPYLDKVFETEFKQMEVDPE